ncbi:MAG: lipopolysaccharide biosynthesis protein [Deltaproteobacteria bacterium]|nr:lipopolysaccharide biosynthesis protein [Deltaproteobacteria bacterium]
MKRITLSPFLKDIGITTLTSFITILSLIFVTRFLARGLGPDEFGAYALARRLVSFIAPFSTLALGVSLARYTALFSDGQRRKNLLAVSLSIIIIMAIILSIPWFLWGEYFTKLVFRTIRFTNLFYASFFMVGGYGIYSAVYAFYRGTGKMNKANLLQLCVMSLLPLLISYFFGSRADALVIILLMGLSFYLSLLPLGYNLKGIRWNGLELVKKAARDLLVYGIPRMPGSIAFAGLLSIGPFLAPYFGSIDEAGFFVVGQSVFRIMESAVVAFGLVALPRVAIMFEEGRKDFLAERIRDIIDLIIHVGLFISVQAFIWAKFVIVVWLGADYLEAVAIMRILIISLAPYLAYVLLRSFIDAIEVRAVNTLNILVSLGSGILSALLCAFVGMGVLGLAIGSMTGFFVLGIRTVFYLKRRFCFLLWRRPITVRVLILNGIILIFSLAINTYCFQGEYGIISLGKLFLLEAVLSAGYIALLRHWRAGWLKELNIRIGR